jgi:hypothetical protein
MRIFLYHPEKVRIKQGLPAQDRNKMDPHLLTLCQDPFDQFIGKLGFGAIS